jgi:ATP-dependent helicase STH1/SNF2
MNDDELNKLIAHHKSEVAIFHEMDIQREKDALESWRAQGKRGNPPLPLMQFEELPDCYQTDEPFDIKDVEDLVEGRGQRRRNIVGYSQALEKGENIEELSEHVKDKRSDTYKTNFSKKMIHRDEERPHQKPASDLEYSDYFHAS